MNWIRFIVIVVIFAWLIYGFYVAGVRRGYKKGWDNGTNFMMRVLEEKGYKKNENP